MALSVVEREEFLAQPHIGALSVVERPDRGPLTIPISYQDTPGGELWVLPDSRGRCPPATSVRWRWPRATWHRTKVAEFVEYERTELGVLVAIHMRPEHWLSADLGAT